MASSLHRELCSAAVEWLLRPGSKGGPGCTVAFSEVQSPCGREVMDAFGVRSVGWETYSVLVEAKISRADFRADFSKPHRQDPSLSAGTYRYYLAPAGMISTDELPPRWGLVEYGRPRFRVAAGHLAVRAGPSLRYDQVPGQRVADWAHDVNHGREVGTVARLLARLGNVETLQNELKRVRGKHTRQQAMLQRLHESERISRADTQLMRWILDERGIDFDQALADLRDREAIRLRRLRRQRDQDSDELF